MNEQILKNCYKKSLELHRAKEAKELLSSLNCKSSVEISKLLGCSNTYIYDILKGKLPISAKMLHKINNLVKK